MNVPGKNKVLVDLSAGGNDGIAQVLQRSGLVAAPLPECRFVTGNLIFVHRKIIESGRLWIKTFPVLFGMESFCMPELQIILKHDAIDGICCQIAIKSSEILMVFRCCRIEGVSGLAVPALKVIFVNL
ncbi:MAG: hypothetical protein U9P37_07375, partial [Pseudomonadota bacterium]|nr:hypothetical protein [Pseudomonadota bacterium]